MKKILTICIILLSFNSIAKSDSTHNSITIGIDGSSEVTNVLRELAVELGTTTEYLWEVTVKQGKVASFKGILWGIVFCILGILTSGSIFRAFVNSYKKDKAAGGNPDGDWVAAGIVLTLVSLVIFAFITRHNINEAIDGSMNPEYWALETILDKIK